MVVGIGTYWRPAISVGAWSTYNVGTVLEGRCFVTFLGPKFHLPAHVASCQTAFSFNLTCRVSRTEEEAPEQGWSDINPLASQTKVMGPASHGEMSYDHLND